MNLLALDTSTDVMSIAVQRFAGGAPEVWQHTGAGGAQASATLIPVIQRLMQQAGLQFDDLAAIVFGRGPGSFTGLRTACSVAQGLAFGAGVPVLPVDTLQAVAEEARQLWGASSEGLCATGAPGHFSVLAVLDARMDEVYAAAYEFNSAMPIQHADHGLVKPENLVLPVGWFLAGNAAGAYGDRLPGGPARRIAALPTALALLRLAPALLAAGHAVPADLALPLYIRDKVARTTQERAQDKLLKANA